MLFIQKNNAVIYSFGNTNPETVNITMITGTDLKVQIGFFTFFNDNIYHQISNIKCEVLSATSLDNSVEFTGLPFTVYAYDDFQLALKTPQILTTTVVSFSQINLAIKDNNTSGLLISEVVTIYVEYCVNDGDNDWILHGTTERTATTYSVVGLTANTNYKFRIKSVVTAETFESEYSNITGSRTQ